MHITCATCTMVMYTLSAATETTIPTKEWKEITTALQPLHCKALRARKRKREGRERKRESTEAIRLSFGFIEPPLAFWFTIQELTHRVLKDKHHGDLSRKHRPTHKSPHFIILHYKSSAVVESRDVLHVKGVQSKTIVDDDDDDVCWTNAKRGTFATCAGCLKGCVCNVVLAFAKPLAITHTFKPHTHTFTSEMHVMLTCRTTRASRLHHSDNIRTPSYGRHQNSRYWCRLTANN